MGVSRSGNLSCIGELRRFCCQPFSCHLDRGVECTGLDAEHCEEAKDPYECVRSLERWAASSLKLGLQVRCVFAVEGVCTR